jgi:phosphatidylserine/phosphatidylglycerophosphate/cardiolipin synthase-like enzyme
MLKIISANLWDTIQKKAKRSEYRRAAIAYVTDPTLLPLRNGDLLVTDASDASIPSGRTSAITLEKYFKAEVELFNLPDLHAKVLVLDDWAVVGSANASHQSAAVYFEAAMLSEDPSLLGRQTSS